MDISVTIDFAPLARELGLPEEQLRSTVELLDEGNTVPFITRYRKDRTGGLDEEQIRQVQDRVTRERMLAERKRTILKSIESQGKLTDELAQAIAKAGSTKRLEDLYLPFKPKKQTLATIAREKGLEPLAREILRAEKIAEDLDRRALDFVDVDKGLRSQADVLLGVGHLIAEHFSERAELREALRAIVRNSGKIVCSKAPSSEEKEDGELAAAKETARPDETSGENTQGPSESGEGARPEPAEQEVSQQRDSQQESPKADAGSAEAPAPAAPAGGTGEGETQSSAQSESGTQETPPGAPSPGAPSPGGQAKASAEPTEAVAPAETASEDQTAASPDAAETAPAPPPSEPDPVAKAAEEKRRKEQARAERRKRKEEEKKRKRKRKEAAYKDYFNFEQPLAKLPPHRILAINRGERARVLRVKLDADHDAMRAKAEELAIPAEHPHSEFLRGCLKDALARLIFPALEREVRRELTDKAEEHAVTVFARNLRKLLLMPPVSRHRVLAIDPGFKSGCKLAALDEFGNLHGHGAIYLVGPQERQKRSRARLVEMITLHKITVVAIGNGTACRETERLVADVLANELKDDDVQYVIVNEAGASVYSTSPVGREELGQYEAAQRSAVSIGRRLLDPLSELVKINPANIGVGLYQHDMKAKHLQDSLDAVVESCVNYVGVDLNTASPSLLKHVSGLNQLTARRIYEHRQQHGPFSSREQLNDVPGVGEATFVQAAGFLRITGGENPLDATWIHPESYDAARGVLEKIESSVDELASQVNVTQTALAAKRRQSAEFAVGVKATPAEQTETSTEPPGEEAATEPQVVNSTAGIGDAPADAAEAPAIESSTEASPPEEAAEQPLSEDQAAPAAEPPAEQTASPAPVAVETADSVETAESTEADSIETAPPTPPAETPPTTKLVEKVATANPESLAQELEIGELLCRDILGALKRPGRDPREDLPPPTFRREILKLEDLKPGMQLSGTVLNVVDFGAFVDIGLHDTGLVHISRLADRYIKDPHEVVGVGDTLDVWVLGVDKQRRRVQLTAIRPGTEKAPQRRGDKRRPRSESQDKDQRPAGEKSGERRPRRKPDRRDRGKGRREGRGHPSKPFVLESKKEKKPKLTKAMKEGRAPLRTFGDLQQFISLQQDPDAPPEESAKQKPPKNKPQPSESGEEKTAHEQVAEQAQDKSSRPDHEEPTASDPTLQNQHVDSSAGEEASADDISKGGESADDVGGSDQEHNTEKQTASSSQSESP